jgi:hypothetical protein
MATVEEILVQFASEQATAGANAAAAAFERFAKASETAGAGADAVDEKIKRAGPTMEQIAAKTDGVAAAAGRIEAAHRRWAASFDTVMAQLARGDLSTTQAAQFLQRLSVLRDQDIASAQAWGAKLEAKFATVADATNKATAAQQRFNELAGITPISDDYAKRAGDIAAYGAALDATRAKFNPVFAAAQQYREALAEVSTALKTGAIDSDEAAQANARLSNAYTQTKARLAEVEATLGTVAQAQQRYNTLAGITPITGSDDYAKRSADIAAYGNEMDRLRAKYNPLFAASKQYEAVLEEIADAQRKGALSSVEAEAAQERATQAFSDLNAPLGRAAGSAKNVQFAMRDLGLQSIDVFQGLATGQPVLTTFIQQGSQVAQVAAASGVGFKQMADGVKGLVASGLAWVASNPIIVAAAAAAAAIVYLAASGESAAKQQANLRASLALTRDDYASMADAVQNAAKRVAASSDLTVSEAMQIGQTLARLPSVSGAGLESITQTIAGLSRAMGIDLPAATQLAVQALKDPAKAAVELATGTNQIKQMDGATLDLVNRLVAAGDKSGATALVLSKMGEAAKESQAQTTPLAEAWKQVREAWNGAASDGESLGGWLGKIMDAWVADMTRGLARIVGWVADVRAAWAKLPSSGGSGGPIPDEFGGTVEPVTPSAAATNAGNVVGRAGPNGVLQSTKSSAMGFGGITQGTADFLHIDATDPTQNMQGIYKYLDYIANIRDSSGAYKYGTINQQLAAYNQGPDASPAKLYGEGAAYANAILNTSTKGLPADTAALNAKVGQGYSADRQTIVAQITMHESSGNQYYQGSGTARPPGSDIVATPAAAATQAGVKTGTEQFGPPQFDATHAQNSIAGAQALSGTLTDDKRISDLTQRLKEYQATRDDIIAKNGGSVLTPEALEQVASYDRAIAQTAADLDAARDPTAQQTRALNDQAQATAVVGDADRRLLQTQQEIAAHNRDNPAFPITDAQAAARITAAMADQGAGAQKLAGSMALTITQNHSVAEAWKQGSAAVEDATAQNQAVTTAMQFFDSKAPGFAKHVQDIKQAYLDVATSQHEVAAAQEANNNAFQADYLQAEISTLGMNSDARALLLQHMKDEHELRQQLGKDYDKFGPQLLEERDSVAKLSQEFQNQQASLNYLSNQFSQAFDTIGNAMTQAFVSGQGQAVNWGNVMSAVVQQVIQAFIKLAVINPILNALFSQSNPTFSSVLGALGGGGSSSGSGSFVDSGTWDGVSSAYTGLSTVSSLSGAFGGPTIGSALGITGEGGLLSQAGTYLGLTGPGGLFSGATGFLSTGVGTLAGYTPGTAAFASAAGLSPAAGGVATLGSTLSGFAGGVGAGYGIGSLTGGAVQGALNKTGPGPQIGAGAGALAGAGIGFVVSGFNPVGALIGGIIGGTAGGTLGGFFGPHPASPYSSNQVTVSDDGHLSLGRVAYQGIEGTQETDALRKDMDTINNFMDQFGILLTNKGAEGGGFQSDNELFQVGQNSPKGPVDPTKYATLDDAFGNLTFTSPDPLLNEKVLSKGPFKTYEDFSKQVADYENAQTSLTALLATLNNTVDTTGKTTGTFVTTIKGLNDTTDAAVASAEKLKATNMLSDEQTKQLTLAEENLKIVRDQQIAAAQDAVNYARFETDAGLTYRYMTAAATLSGSAQDSLNAALYQFDNITSPQQRRDMTANLVSIFGDSFTSTTDYAQQMARLERTLAEERLAIIKQGNDQITAADQAAAQEQAQTLAQAQQSAGSLLDSIGQYVAKLQTGSDSALSPQAQYQLASRQFNAVSGAAAAGDFNSASQVTTYADALLNASRSVNGSGTGYVQDTNRVLTALSGIAGMSTDALTASALAAIQKSSTDQITTKLGDVQAVLVQMLNALKSTNGKPASLAA